MNLWKWLFGIGDIDAYYVPRMMYETLQHELAEAQRQLDAAKQEMQILSEKNKKLFYAELQSKQLSDHVKRLQDRNATLSSHNRFWEDKAAQLLGLLEYNNVPGSAYVRMPGPVCSSINQEAITMLHRRFEIYKDAK